MYKQKITILLLLLCGSLSLLAQKEQLAKNRQGETMEFEACAICTVAKMTGEFEDDLVVKNDDSGEPYSGEDFVVGSATTNPIAYVSGRSMALKGTIELDCSDLPMSIRIRGKSERFDFESVPIAVEGNNIVSYTTIEASTPFTPLTVDMLDLVIDWEVSLDNGAIWEKIGVSRNRVYVTWKEPLAEIPGNSYRSSPGYEWYESVYAVSCKGAKGTNQESAIIDGVWSAFEAANVQKADGSNLHYYLKSDPDPSATVATELIKNKNGQCYSWCGLFISTLKIQGIEGDLETIEFWANQYGDPEERLTGFLVKNWYFHAQNTVGSTYESSIKNEFDYTHIRVYKRVGNSYPVTYNLEVYPFDGIPGQNESDPVSSFKNHAVVRIGKTQAIYDPSYGQHGSYNSISEYEEQNIAGFEFEHFKQKIEEIDETLYNIDFNENGVLETNAIVYMQFYKANGNNDEVHIRHIYKY